MDLDPGSLDAIGAAVSLKSTVDKVLGPTADYLGEGLLRFTQKRVENLNRIFQRAETKIDESNRTQGAVPPRVVKDVMDYGSFTEDIYTSEYFAGVLAASKSGITRDDRGAAVTQTVIGMTSYQIRAHYLLYLLFHDVYGGQDLNIADGNVANNLKLFVPMQGFAIGIGVEEGEDFAELIAHIIFGLNHLDLITGFAYGDPELILKNVGVKPDGNGLVVRPTVRGAELLLWALSAPSLNPAEFFKIDLSGCSKPRVMTIPGYRSLTPLETEPISIDS